MSTSRNLVYRMQGYNFVEQTIYKPSTRPSGLWEKNVFLWLRREIKTQDYLKLNIPWWEKHLAIQPATNSHMLNVRGEGGDSQRKHGGEEEHVWCWGSGREEVETLNNISGRAMKHMATSETTNLTIMRWEMTFKKIKWDIWQSWWK